MKTALRAYRELEEKSVLQYFPKRKNETHKGDYGKVLLICGSRGFTGAAVFAAQAAARTGSGLVYLCVPESIYYITASALLEPVIIPLPEENGCISENAVPAIMKLAESKDAVLAGPGMGLSKGPEKLIQSLLQDCEIPVLLDADGITLAARHCDWLRNHKGPLVLTPHDGEFLRLQQCQGNSRYSETVRCAKDNSCVLLRKGYHTLISDGNICYRNRTGNPGMAKGGSGDVLSGIIVSMLGRGIPPLMAAACGAWIHGRCGDIARDTYGEYAMLPSDLIDLLPYVLP